MASVVIKGGNLETRKHTENHVKMDGTGFGEHGHGKESQTQEEVRMRGIKERLEVRPGLRGENRQREVGNLPVCPPLTPPPQGSTCPGAPH